MFMVKEPIVEQLTVVKIFRCNFSYLSYILGYMSHNINWCKMYHFNLTTKTSFQSDLKQGNSSYFFVLYFLPGQFLYLYQLCNSFLTPREKEISRGL